MYYEEDIHKYNVITHQGLNRKMFFLKFIAYNIQIQILNLYLNKSPYAFKKNFLDIEIYLCFFMFDLNSRTKNTFKITEL